MPEKTSSIKEEVRAEIMTLTGSLKRKGVRAGQGRHSKLIRDSPVGLWIAGNPSPLSICRRKRTENLSDVVLPCNVAKDPVLRGFEDIGYTNEHVQGSLS